MQRLGKKNKQKNFELSDVQSPFDKRNDMERDNTNFFECQEPAVTETFVFLPSASTLTIRAAAALH